MSELSPFIRAFRALAASCEHEAQRAKAHGAQRGAEAEKFGISLALGLTYAAFAFKSAAFDLEQQDAEQK